VLQTVGCGGQLVSKKGAGDANSAFLGETELTCHIDCAIFGSE